jgi:glycosyltransferase involved in cell wall biosynthesis
MCRGRTPRCAATPTRREPGSIMCNVLHVSQPSDGGVAGYVTEVCGDQVARGWKVMVACPEEGDLARQIMARGAAWFPWAAGREPGVSVLAEAVRLRRIVAAAEPDVIHLHSSKAGLAGRLLTRDRRPTLFQPHGWSWLAAPPWMAPAVLAWERRAARRTTHLICVGRGEARHGHESGVPGRYSIVRNGVDLTRFRPAGTTDRATARRRMGLAPEAALALCVGRITRQKGQDVLLSAWPQVRALRPDAELVLLGAADGLPVRSEGDSGVRFHDPVRDVSAWYAAADVVVLPSRWEGLPLTLLEAMAMGRAVVGSDIPGIAEELPAGAGALVPPDDPSALALAIGERLRRPDLAGEEGACGARYATAHLDVRRTHEALATITENAALSTYAAPNSSR